MNYTVYILRSQKDASYYIGYTHDLDSRLERHNLGRVKFTKAKRPWDLVYFENFPDKSSAMAREAEIKRRKSSKFIDSLVRTSRQP